MSNNQRGWTLLELMTVLAVVAVLITVALPPLQIMAQRLRIGNAAQEFASWTSMARSEAIKRRRGRVVLCVASTPLACNTQGDWQQGWLMFHDVNNNAQLDPEDTVIRYQSALSSGLVIRGNNHVSRYISYTAVGRTFLISGALQLGTVTICHEGGDVAGWQAVLSATGRVRLVRWVPDVC
jgi:type IV fimbrial biogenesis protein FimT